jgi:hypothetical protein
VFGIGGKRKAKAVEPVEPDEAEILDSEDVAESDADESGLDSEAVTEAEADEADLTEADADAEDQDADDLDEEAEFDDVDWREDGPFDIDEVDLGDEERIDLDALVVTGFPGLQLQLAQNQAGKVQSALAVWHKSALECTLFAEAVSISAGAAVRQRLSALAKEAVEAGGEVTWEDESGAFGPQVQLVVPVENAKAKGKSKGKGAPLVQVSRVWAVKGPRWLLQGRLFGDFATLPPDDPKVGVFVEFFRNLVVRRGAVPLPPGELIALSLPQGGSEGESDDKA